MMTQVMRHTRGLGIRPVNRIKHVIDAEGTITTTISTTDVIVTNDTPDLATVNECETGSKVMGIYLKVECTRLAGVGRGNFYMSVSKNPANTVSAVAPNVVGSSAKKRYVLHQEMIMLGEESLRSPRVMFNGVIKIPRGFSRNGPNDKLQVNLIAGTASQTADFCLQCHYKEFR